MLTSLISRPFESGVRRLLQLLRDAVRAAGLPFLVLLVITSFACWIVFDRAIVPAMPLLTWDEALHALYGLRIAQDIQQGDVLGFLYDSYRQVMWPPLHSWYLAIWFLIFPPSSTLARLTSLPPLVGCVITLYATGCLLGTAFREQGRTQVGDKLPALDEGSTTDSPFSSKGGWSNRRVQIAGFTAGSIFLGAAGSLLLASQVMLELPGLFWLSVCFWLYVQSWRFDARRSRRIFILLGLAVCATYLTRSSYGVLVALALTGAFWFDGKWFAFLKERVFRHSGGRREPVSSVLEEQAARRRGQLWTAAALAVPLAIWFAYPAKIGSSLTNLVNSPMGPDRFSLDGILFFPRALLWLAGSWPMLILWLGATALTLWSSRLRSDGRLRFFVLFLALLAVLAELSVNKQERFILPFIPVFALLTGYWASPLWSRLGSLRAPSLIWRAGVAGVGLFLAVWLHLNALGEIIGNARYYPRDPSHDQHARVLLDRLDQDLEQRGPALILATTHSRPGPPSIDWALAVSGHLRAIQAGSLVHSAEQQFRTLTARLPEPMQGPLRQLATRYPGEPNSGTYSAYVGYPQTGAMQFTPSNYGQWLSELLRQNPSDRILVLVRNPDPGYPTLSPNLIQKELNQIGYISEPNAIYFDNGRLQLLSFRIQ